MNCPGSHQPDSEPCGRWQRRSEDRHAEILEAGFEVFGEKGFRRATIAAVATRAGVSPGTVCHYFGSKIALFEAIVAEWAQKFVANEEALLATHRGTATELLQLLLRRLWDHLRTPGTLQFLHVIQFEASTFPESGRVMYRQLSERWRRLLGAVFALGRRNGEFRAFDEDVAERLIPFMVVGVAQKMAMYRQFDVEMPDQAAMLEGVWQAVQRFVIVDGTPADDSATPQDQRSTVDEPREVS